MEGIFIKVEDRRRDYMDFTVSADEQTLYRYESQTGKIRKLFGFGGYGQAVRGKNVKRSNPLLKSFLRTIFLSPLQFECLTHLMMAD